MKYIVFAVLVASVSLPVAGQSAKSNGGSFTLHQSNAQNSSTAFLHALDSIRMQLKIPGMAVAVEQGDSILFAAGLGYADLENKIKATDRTVFRVASVTKTLTSTLAMQLVEEGKMSLDSPITKYGVDLGNPAITVRNLLTHTSEGEPGSHFSYNGYRYGRLGPVIEKASGVPFYELLMEKIIMPLHMTSSAPSISIDEYYRYLKKNRAILPYFDTAFGNLAKPYELNGKNEVVASTYQNEFGAFGGLATNVYDLLKYSKAIDQNKFISAATQQQVFSANRTRSGEVTPYGLGWFVEKYDGTDFYWHYGQTQAESALFVKVPSLRLTLVVMCNTVYLSAPFQLGDGDLLMSPVGQLFYTTYINKQPCQSFLNRKLIVDATLALLNNDTAKARRDYNAYANMNFKALKKIPSGKLIAALRNVGVNKNLQQSFTLVKPTNIRIVGVGENCSADGSSWCDYGWIENTKSKMVWQMQGQKFSGAGGANKNQKVETTITLPAGKYILKYKSDSAHAFDSWDSLPPDDFFWGILLFNDTTP